MASTRRRSHPALSADLFEHAQHYELFQAIRQMERLAAHEHAERGLPPVEPVGRSIEPDRAPLRIRTAVPLGFAADEVTAIRRSRSGGPDEMIQTPIGLSGAAGVLPHAISELVQVSVRERNLGLRDFFDVFNNRLAALLYDGWAKYRIHIERDRGATVGTPETATQSLRSVVGLGQPALRDRTSVPDSTFIFFSGLLARQGRSAMAIGRILSGTLGHPVRIEQFHGEWQAIAPSDRTRLPDRINREGRFARLGDDAVIGERIFDIQSVILIHVGPLDYADFRSLLPDGERAILLTDLAAMAVGADKSFRIRLELSPDAVPALQLTRDPDRPESSRLGWNSWLSPSKPRPAAVTAEFRPLPHLR